MTQTQNPYIEGTNILTNKTERLEFIDAELSDGRWHKNPYALLWIKDGFDTETMEQRIADRSITREEYDTWVAFRVHCFDQYRLSYLAEGNHYFADSMRHLRDDLEEQWVRDRLKFPKAAEPKLDYPALRFYR